MRKEKGITLVALIITIIIMLILVAVSVNVIIKSNLIGTAEKAANGYKTAYERENDGSITINGKTYSSLDEYMEEINPTIVEGNIEDWGYTEEDDGTITITKYLNTDTTIDTVVIPNYIDGKPVKAIRGKIEYVDTSMLKYKAIWNDDICSEEETFVDSIVQSRYANENTSVHKIIVSEGIENISEYAFVLSTGLTEVKLPSTLKYAGNYMFAYCSGIKKIILPNSVTSIGEVAFSGCTSLREITIPNSVTGIGRDTFSGCTSLQEITLPSSIIRIGERAFSGCTSLQKITIPSSVTSIGEGAFRGCTSLQEVTIPSSVTTMKREVFFNIPSITVYVPWKKDEEKPKGWDSNWNATMNNCIVTIVYAK